MPRNADCHPSPRSATPASINHVAALCPLKAQQAPSPQGKPTYFPEEEEEIHSSVMLPEAQN